MTHAFSRLAPIWTRRPVAQADHPSLKPRPVFSRRSETLPPSVTPQVVAVLAPVCADKFRALPDVSARTATLTADKDDSYKMREAFPEALIT
jgi:hypothetical protein